MLGAVLVFIVICFMGTNFRIIHALGWPFMVRSRAPSLLGCNPSLRRVLTLALMHTHITWRW
eukprot:COSAG04_NODE_864_length_9792_cov_22.506035_11_plen_62_part_00